MIYGVDPGVRKLALFGVGYDDDEPHVVHTFKVGQLGRGNEVTGLRRALSRVLDRDPEAVIFCEEPVVAGARNLRTTIQIAQTVGAVLSVEQPVYLVPVSTWKKETVGRGNAGKPDVSDWLRQEWISYFHSCDSDQDCVDAAAIAVYGRGVVRRSVDPSARGAV